MNPVTKSAGDPVELFVAYRLYGGNTGNFCFLVVDQFLNGIIALKLVCNSGSNIIQGFCNFITKVIIFDQVDPGYFFFLFNSFSPGTVS